MQAQSGILLGDDVFGYAPGRTVLISFSHGHISAVQPVGAVDLPALGEAAGGNVLDMRGRLVLPGLIDAHMHAIATGMILLDGMVREAASLEQLREMIRAAAAEGRDFIRLAGLDSSRFNQVDLEQLDRAWLDDAVPDRPLFLKSVEGHAGWFNSRAWDRVGVDAVLERLDIAAGDRREMRRSGRVYGNSYENLTTPVYDSYSLEERRQGMDLVIKQAQRAGLVGLHCMEGYGDYRRHDFAMMQELDRRDDIDLTLYCRDDTPQTAFELGLNRFGGCWCVDGAIGAHSAALDEPYQDKPGCLGELYFSDDELRVWIEPGLRLDMQVAVHAIGERALDQCLRVFEGLAGSYNLDRLRPRVDHFVMGTPELAQRAAVLGVCSAMQPAFDACWGGADGGYATRLGSERAMRANPLRQMMDNGLRIAGSSDSYITPLDPLGGIRAAMYHHNEAMRVGFDQAVELFSSNAAYLAHQEKERGRIAVGCQADFTVVDGDRRMTADAAVAATIKLGCVVYQAEPACGSD